MLIIYIKNPSPWRDHEITRIRRRTCSPCPCFVPGLQNSTQAEELTVYSARHYDKDHELYKAFEAQTGVKVNVVEAKGDKLLARLQAEGANSPADVLITVDAGRLAKADSLGLFAPVKSDVLEGSILPIGDTQKATGSPLVSVFVSSFTPRTV